jgi:hypothetical protein
VASTQWWQTPDSEGAVITALGHLNHARDLSDGPATLRCELFFKALNALWNAFGRSQQLERGDTTLFVKLAQTLSAERAADVLRSSAARAVIGLDPPVLDHDVLRRRGYRPGADIPGSLRGEATEKHVELVKRYGSWRAAAVESGRLLKTVAEFLYIVRSNIAHGEKTPYGPDFEKARRDELVASSVVPLQEILIDEILGRPSEKLAAYGTLRPGEPNASVMGGVPGEWLDCTLKGERVVSISGLAEFQWDLRGVEIPAKLLTSASLPHHWDRLDAFEGSAYQRHLLPAAVHGTFVVANCYVVRR